MILTEILYDALRAEYGVCIKTTDPIALRAKLYPVKKANEAFACLSLIPSPTNPQTHLWIVKARPPLELDL
jgi:hypothetical protein